MDVPNLTRSVTADKRARLIIASVDGFREATWPPVHSESMGSSSILLTRFRSAPATNPISSSPDSAVTRQPLSIAPL